MSIYKKPSFLLVILAVIILIIVLISLGTNSKGLNANDEPYYFKGQSSIYTGDKYFIAEDLPNNKHEEIVFSYFLYDVEEEFDKKIKILADDETSKIIIENEKKNKSLGLYTNYVLHNLSTIPDKESQNVKDLIDKYKLIEYEIINAVYTRKDSDTLRYLGSQYGDGTISQSFIVGKSANDEDYKIYKFLMPLTVNDDSVSNSEYLSAQIKINVYKEHELVTEREITDANIKIDTLLKIRKAGSAEKKSDSDLPKTPDYIMINVNNDIDVNYKQTYYVYEINSKYYVEEPKESINLITHDDYRYIYNLAYLGAIAQPAYVGLTVSKLNDEEYTALVEQNMGKNNIEKSDFQKINFKFYLEFPINFRNRNIEVPNLDSLININGEGSIWAASSFEQDNEVEPFAIYEKEMILYTKGMDENRIREVLNSFEAAVSWTDEIGENHNYKYNLGDFVIFED